MRAQVYPLTPSIGPDPAGQRLKQLILAAFDTRCRNLFIHSFLSLAQFSIIHVYFSNKISMGMKELNVKKNKMKFSFLIHHATWKSVSSKPNVFGEVIQEAIQNIIKAFLFVRLNFFFLLLFSTSKISFHLELGPNRRGYNVSIGKNDCAENPYMEVRCYLPERFVYHPSGSRVKN